MELTVSRKDGDSETQLDSGNPHASCSTYVLSQRLFWHTESKHLAKPALDVLNLWD